ncbi:MAG: hypothetical protein LBB72_03865 [Spirochaetaceae bacterium]|jgi:hypothetical protein|nr:hypothetical protein [Spirochaetaceae bacterium]
MRFSAVKSLKTEVFRDSRVLIPQGKPCTRRLRRLSAAEPLVLNPSFPHSLDHALASTVAISLRSSINR